MGCKKGKRGRPATYFADLYEHNLFLSNLFVEKRSSLSFMLALRSDEPDHPGGVDIRNNRQAPREQDQRFLQDYALSARQTLTLATSMSRQIETTIWAHRLTATYPSWPTAPMRFWENGSKVGRRSASVNGKRSRLREPLCTTDNLSSSRKQVVLLGPKPEYETVEHFHVLVRGQTRRCHLSQLANVESSAKSRWVTTVLTSTEKLRKEVLLVS
jgi:hypothetical protein